MAFPQPYSRSSDAVDLGALEDKSAVKVGKPCALLAWTGIAVA